MEELEKSFFFRLAILLMKPSILEGRIVKVPHSTQTTILQLVDPACAAAQDHVETRIWNFIFCQFFSAKLRLGLISAAVTGGGIREIFSFFRLAILLMKRRVSSRVE